MRTRCSACGTEGRGSAVSARSRGKDRGHDLSKLAWHDEPVKLATDPNIDVFVELMGGEGDPAKSAVEAALKSGKHVITANKALLAHHGASLARLAEANSVALNFEASVAGGIPIVKTIREGLAGNRVGKLFGIMNGTCNYILTKMANEGRSFGDVLKEAQALGYAEADPTFDVGGFDTAHKLAVLTSLAFGTEVNVKAIEIEGIEAITLSDIRNASDMGYKIKLLGVAVASEQGVEQRVHPTLIPKGSPVADTDGVFNAVVVKGDFVGDLMLEGRGAGRIPPPPPCSPTSSISRVETCARPSACRRRTCGLTCPRRPRRMRVVTTWRSNCRTSRARSLPSRAFWRTRRSRSRASCSVARPRRTRRVPPRPSSSSPMTRWRAPCARLWSASNATAMSPLARA